MITALGVILTIFSILSNKCCRGGGIIPHGNDHYNATNKWSDDIALNIPYIRHQMTDISVIREGGRH